VPGRQNREPTGKRPDLSVLQFITELLKNNHNFYCLQ
jgi:hypothetical protein